MTAAVVRRAEQASAEMLLKRLRVSLIYLWRHGRWPDLDRPTRFTEWVQRRKLYDRDQRLARLTDKSVAKAHAERIGGKGIAVPTLWQGKSLPVDPPAPLPLVVKANHGCNQFRIVRTRHDWDAARHAARRWLRHPYGAWLDEWHYAAAGRSILVEPFVGRPDDGLPLDYKVYVFGGRAAVVQLHVGRGRNHRWSQFDRDWRALSEDAIAAPPPRRLGRMLDLAERLAAGHDFLRVDFYEVDGRLWFGEYCLFPGSGLDPFHPDSLDLALGRLWTEAQGSRDGSLNP